jgi:hypothetical protein
MLGLGALLLQQLLEINFGASDVIEEALTLFQVFANVLQTKSRLIEARNGRLL